MDLSPHISIAYLLCGIGLLGAAKHWSHVGWAWYSVLFPVHAITLSLAKDLWPYVRAFLTSTKVHCVIVFLFVWYVLCGGWSG